jgi:uncharacterized damage-inducible protein DinB
MRPTMSAPPLDDLLLAHLEYAAWAVERTFAMLDRLPEEALTAPVVSSFPSILATMQHLYQWERYYFTRLQGGTVALEAVVPPATYAALREGARAQHAEMLAWARASLAADKEVVLHGWAQWPVWMLVMQIANHTTHHLGQVLTLLRQTGYAPEAFADWTDLILYYLQRYPVATPALASAGAGPRPAGA